MRSYESETVRDGYLRLRGWIVLLGEREMVLKLLLPTLHSFAPHCKIKWSICIFRGWRSSTYFRFQEIGVKCSSVVEQMKLEDFLLPFETWFGSWWTCPEGQQLLELWTSAAWLLQSIIFRAKIIMTLGLPSTLSPCAIRYALFILFTAPPKNN